VYSLAKDKFCLFGANSFIEVLDLNADAHLNIYYHVMLIQIYVRLIQFYSEENHVF
jgi:hypothetical protein